MGGGGGGNVFENIYNEIAKKEEDIIGTSALTDVSRETKGVYDYMTGETARKQKEAEKDAKKKAKAAQAKAKQKMEEEKDLAASRKEVEKKRSAAAGAQSRKEKKGRRSTILTDTLGSAGGEENQGRKSLLGY